MNVIETLNEHGIRKFRFAKDFLLSRPTLDEYINKFEAGEPLPKSKYQIIFDSLFTKNLGVDDFDGRYNSLKNLIKRDRMMRLDELNADNTDDIIFIVDSLKKSINDDGKSELIPFVKYVVENHDNDSIVDIWVKYFNDLNNLSDVDDYGTFDKKYIGAFFRLNNAYLYNQNELKKIDDGYYEDFLKRKRENKALADEKTATITNKIEQIISKYVADAVANSSDEDDNDVIIKKVLERINCNS